MCPRHLEQLVLEDRQKGLSPFFVNCTSGTTVYGAFDPINAIADICQKFGLWLHIDVSNLEFIIHYLVTMCLKCALPRIILFVLQAAWGGGLLMSSTQRAGKFSGVERADSLTWNPHKLMGVLLQCSTLHLKEKGILADCNTMKARYLFQQDKHYDVSYDTGDKADWAIPSPNLMMAYIARKEHY